VKATDRESCREKPGIKATNRKFCRESRVDVREKAGNEGRKTGVLQGEAGGLKPLAGKAGE